jgi:2-succinyl-6-hydroxy-2,4-cyclohexadiene-1-carboxylate synthase
MGSSRVGAGYYLNIQHREFEVGDGLSLHAAVSGSGAPLTILHGFTGAAQTWESLRLDFDGDHRVIAVDLPGHGLSSSPADPRRYSLRRFADDLLRVMDNLGIERTALLGYSMGGRAALHFTVAHGDRIAGLILESTSPGMVEPELRQSRARADEELALFIERKGIPAFVDRWENLPLWESQWGMPASARFSLRAQRLRNNQTGLANSLRGAGPSVDPLSKGDLALINVPTLLIAGALDTKYVGIARDLAGEIRHSRTVIIPDAGHAIHIERPGAFAKAVQEFLNALSPVRHTRPHV